MYTEPEDTSTKLEHLPLKIKDDEIWKIPNMAAWSGVSSLLFRFVTACPSGGAAQAGVVLPPLPR